MRLLLKRIFLVHKCVGCRKILDHKDFEQAFCYDCREKYFISKMEICPECSLEAERCRCMPTLLRKDSVTSLRKLFFYSKSKGGEPQNRLVYYLKRNKSRRVASNTARELATLLKGELARLDVGRELLLVSVPRSRSALFEQGFDQSTLIARYLSEACGIEYAELFKRRRGGKAQKKLTAGERRKNIRSLIYACKGADEQINGKTVILLDDVVTTGASMSACVQVLKSCGADRIVCIALASDIKN